MEFHARRSYSVRESHRSERLDSSRGTPTLPREEIERSSYSYLQAASLHLEQAAAQRDRHRMRSVLCLEFSDEIFDVKVDRRLGDG
jgi:hypothetical protein